VEENQGGPGVDGVTITDFGVFLDRNLAELRDALVSARYVPQPLLRVAVDKKDGGTRLLSIPTVRDRIAQTSAALVLTPVLDPGFEECSYAYRAGRSVQMAVHKILAHQRQGYQWVVDADITAYFDEVDHGLMLETLAQQVDDTRLLHLVGQWLQQEVQEGDRIYPLEKGLAQGSPLSPLLANLYLDRFDEAILGKGHRLVRFADDFVILCKSRPAAERALELTENLLDGLKLRLHPDKTRITNFDHGFRFLGVQFIKSLAFRPEDAQTPRLDRSMHLPVVTTSGIPVASIPAADPATLPDDTAVVVGLQQVQVAPQEGSTDYDDGPWEALREGLSANEQKPSSDNDPLLRTLYLMEQGCVLSKEGERFVLSKDGVLLRVIPAIKIDLILVFGNIQITTPALQFCLVRDIPIVLLSSRGRYYGTVEAVGTDRVLLQRDQFLRAADPAFCLAVGRELSHGKIAGSRLLLRRYERKRGTGVLQSAVQTLRRLEDQLVRTNTLEQVRGFEGAAAAAYFEAIRGLLDASWGFTRRARQPPPDPVNAVLSYAYTLLFYNVYALLRAHGLNPNVGFFHPVREGHPALASDIMEEFRAVVVDAIVWPLFLNGGLKVEDFDFAGGADFPCRIRETARKRITHAFEKKMNSDIIHPRTGTRGDYRRLIAAQVRLMAQAVRGEVPYQALVLK
jgi:CRISPR-associated protein Cas1